MLFLSLPSFPLHTYSFSSFIFLIYLSFSFTILPLHSSYSTFLISFSFYLAILLHPYSYFYFPCLIFLFFSNSTSSNSNTALILSSSPQSLSSSTNSISSPRLVIKTSANVDCQDDGYHWRKYGQKTVKGTYIFFIIYFILFFLFLDFILIERWIELISNIKRKTGFKKCNLDDFFFSLLFYLLFCLNQFSHFNLLKINDIRKRNCLIHFTITFFCSFKKKKKT